MLDCHFQLPVVETTFGKSTTVNQVCLNKKLKLKADVSFSKAR